MVGSRGNTGLNKEEAERIAISALGFIASEEERLIRFLNLTGYSPETIRSQAGSPEFLAGVLDFLLGDESDLLVFASHSQIDPSTVAAARHVLGGESFS